MGDNVWEWGRSRVEAISLGSLGNAYDFLGQYQRALDFDQQHNEIAREIGDRSGEATSYFNLALTQVKLDDHWAAKQNFEQAKAIFTELKLDHRVETCDQAIRQRNQIIAATLRRVPALGEASEPALPNWWEKSLPANETKTRSASSSKLPAWAWFTLGLGLILLITWLRR